METIASTSRIRQLPAAVTELCRLIVPYFFLFLFIYTAYDKLTDHQSFQAVLASSVLIGPSAPYLSWLIPFTELGISIFLLVPRTQYIALWASFVLMVVFTAYLVYMISSGSKLSCHCGGVISRLTWQQHIWFNSCCILLAALALRRPISPPGTNKTSSYSKQTIN